MLPAAPLCRMPVASDQSMVTRVVGGLISFRRSTRAANTYGVDPDLAAACE